MESLKITSNVSCYLMIKQVNLTSQHSLIVFLILQQQTNKLNKELKSYQLKLFKEHIGINNKQLEDY
jgi:hypothetical protein